MIQLIKRNAMETTIGLVVVLVLLGMFALGNNDETERTVIVCPITGTQSVKFDNGLFWELGCSTETYNNELTDELDNGVAVRYRDGGKGQLDGILRAALPDDEITMLKLHADFRSEEGVRNKLLRPTIEQALNLTAGMVTSEEAYATKRDNIQEYAEDQIEHGSYETEVLDNEDGSTTVKILKGEDGLSLHRKSPFTAYGLSVSSFQVTDWTFEQATETQIQTKRKAEMAEITAKSEAQTAKQEAITVVEQGKKAEAEAEYQQKVIAQVAIQEAEREKQVAILEAEKIKETNLLMEEAAVIDVRTAQAEAQAEIERASGIAKAKTLKVKADNYTLEKIEAIVQMNKDNAMAYAKRQVPTTMMVMGEGGNASDLDAQTAAFMNANIVKSMNALNTNLNTK